MSVLVCDPLFPISGLFILKCSLILSFMVISSPVVSFISLQFFVIVEFLSVLSCLVSVLGVPCWSCPPMSSLCGCVSVFIALPVCDIKAVNGSIFGPMACVGKSFTFRKGKTSMSHTNMN